MSNTLQKKEPHALSVAESDRKRLMQQLHDGIGQMLAALNMQLAAARKSLPDSALVLQSIEIMSCLHKEYKDLCRQLLPPTPGCITIEQAFRALCNDAKKDDSPAIDFKNHNFSGTLPQETVLGTYRILQELVLYAIAHSEGAAMEAGIWQRDGQLHLFVRTPEGAASGQPVHNAPKYPLPENVFMRATLLGGMLHVDTVRPGSVNALLVIPCGEC